MLRLLGMFSKVVKLRLIYFYLVLFFPLITPALEGLESLQTRLVQNNQVLISLRQQLESKKSLTKAAWGGFYPKFEAVGGWQENKIDSLISPEKGIFGYIEGRYNLFNGFKDSINLIQTNLDYKLVEIELESKTRDLRLELVEVVSEMIRLHALQNVLDEEYKITQIQKQMAVKKVNAGLTSSIDNLEFDMRESEVQIEQKQIVQMHNEMHQKLFKIFGEDLSDVELDKIKLSSFDELINVSKNFKKNTDANPEIGSAVQENLDYKKSEINIEKAEFEKKDSVSEFMPKLDFILNVGRLTPSEEKPLKFNESKYGVTLTIPLFSGFDVFFKKRSFETQILSSERIKQQTILDYHSNLKILKEKVFELSSLYKINEVKMKNSQKYFDLTNVEYKRGIKNSPDLVGATERMFAAKKRKYEILRDLEILKIKIENL